MLDLLLEGSMLLKKVKQLVHMDREELISFLVEMLQDCIDLDDKMTEFILEFEVLEGGPVYWAVPSKPPDVVEMLDAQVLNEGLNSPSFQFPTVRIGTTMMLYWASQTILWSGTCHLYDTLDYLATPSPNMNGMLEGHYTTGGRSQAFQIPLSTRFREFPALARNVCQSVEFCMRDEMSIPSMIAPLNMILGPLNSWTGFDKEVAWAQSLLLEVQKRGMKIIEYLPQAYG